MSGLGFERATQDRVLRLFQEKLGYRYLGDWKDRTGNSNIEEEILTSVLQRRGYVSAEISGALYQLRGAADVSQTGLYEANRRVYSLLRYGVQVKAAADQPTTTVSLIDWEDPVAARKDDAPASHQAVLTKIAGWGSCSGGGGLIHTTSG